jgi:interferon-induced GTP-binding protein Mx1
VRPWLELAEDLRALSLDKELSVPQIAVMGDQSSGKSSVLEALSGVPFPRGSGLTTRCPVRLVMKKGKPGEKWSAHAATTNAAQQIKVSSPEELAGVIERLTESLTTSASGFSTESIVIRMTSPDAPDLTVVDLPGIVRTATAGQSQAVIQEARENRSVVRVWV